MNTAPSVTLTYFYYIYAVFPIPCREGKNVTVDHCPFVKQTRTAGVRTRLLLPRDSEGCKGYHII